MTAITNRINQLKGIALSDAQIEKMANAKMLLYEDLYKYSSLEHLLDANDGKVILLYRQTENYGHWCCLFKTFIESSRASSRDWKDDGKGKGGKRECVEFLDAYGYRPDDQLKFSSDKFGQGLKMLTLLLMTSPYIITYNDHHYQEKKSSINTCGWHVVARLTNKDMTLAEYNRFINQMIETLPSVHNADDAVVVYCCLFTTNGFTNYNK